MFELKKILIGTLVAISLIAVTSLSAEIQALKLGVDGLACPFCALGLENNLKKLDTVQAVEVHLKNGVADVSVSPGRVLVFSRIEQAVIDAGFTLRNIEVQVSGEVKKRGENWMLISEGDNTTFLLEDTPSVVDRLKKAYSNKNLVTVTGLVTSYQGQSPILAADRVENKSQ